MKKDFSQASKGPAPDVKTRAELLQRMRQRATLKPERHLTPHGQTTLSVNRQVQAENEKRITMLRSSLAEKKLQLRRDLRASKDCGAARAGFAKSASKERTR